MEYPHSFSTISYAKWHNYYFPEDKSITSKLENLIDTLENNSKEDILFLIKFIKFQIESLSGNNFDTTTYSSPIFQADFVESDAYKNLFKRPSSILNKLYRKNKNSKDINLSKLKIEITDLIRTSVTGDTLFSCEKLARKFKEIKFENKIIQEEFDKHIDTIDIEPELKMEAGYFAYHILFRFKNSNIVELQIHSKIFEKWRELSHVLYDKIRLSPNTEQKLGSKEVRLISLGHLFHLAECELNRLEQEWNDDNSQN